MILGCGQMGSTLMGPLQSKQFWQIGETGTRKLNNWLILTDWYATSTSVKKTQNVQWPHWCWPNRWWCFVHYGICFCRLLFVVLFVFVFWLVLTPCPSARAGGNSSTNMFIYIYIYIYAYATISLYIIACCLFSVSCIVCCLSFLVVF